MNLQLLKVLQGPDQERRRAGRNSNFHDHVTASDGCVWVVYVARIGFPDNQAGGGAQDVNGFSTFLFQNHNGGICP